MTKITDQAADYPFITRYPWAGEHNGLTRLFTLWLSKDLAVFPSYVEPDGWAWRRYYGLLRYLEAMGERRVPDELFVQTLRPVLQRVRDTQKLIPDSFRQLVEAMRDS